MTCAIFDDHLLAKYADDSFMAAVISDLAELTRFELDIASFHRQCKLKGLTFNPEKTEEIAVDFSKAVMLRMDFRQL
jgi:hypothetical protein